MFGSQELLDDCTEYCSKHDAVNTVMPKPMRNTLKFKNIQNSLECPVKIYADFESLLEPMDRKHGETKIISAARSLGLLLLRRLPRKRFFHGSRHVREPG